MLSYVNCMDYEFRDNRENVIKQCKVELSNLLEKMTYCLIFSLRIIELVTKNLKYRLENRLKKSEDFFLFSLCIELNGFLLEK